MEELEALLILSSIPQVGSIKIRLLREHYGSAVSALRAPVTEIATFPGFGPKIIQSWKTAIEGSEWRDNLLLAEKLHTQLIPFTSPLYPKRLLEIIDFPLVLYVQGTLLASDQRCLAVVGTRQATLYGQEMARQLSRELAQAGFTIVSGLARGIDTAAHKGALESGRSIAVLGSGLANIYPNENRALAHAICEQGALITEFTMTTPPDRQNFPQRNRIVSGMTMGTLLIEAPHQSGAMLTMEKALEQKRPTFVLPGRADLDTFKGNHSLIKQKKAELIDCSQDIRLYFDDYSLPLIFSPSTQTSIPLEIEEKELLQRMPPQEASIEDLVSLTSQSVGRLNSLLMSLVLKKVIKEYPGKIYKKI